MTPSLSLCNRATLLGLPGSGRFLKIINSRGFPRYLVQFNNPGAVLAKLNKILGSLKAAESFSFGTISAKIEFLNK